MSHTFIYSRFPITQKTDSKMSGFTLDGKPVDDKLPEGWGQSQQRVGRIGDWSRDQVSSLKRKAKLTPVTERHSRARP